MDDEIQRTLTRAKVVVGAATLQLHEAGTATAARTAELLAAYVPLRRILSLYPYQLHEWSAGYERLLAQAGISEILDRRSWNLPRSLARQLPPTNVLSVEDAAAYDELRQHVVIGLDATPGHLHFLVMTAHVLTSSPIATEVLGNPHALNHAHVLLDVLEAVLQLDAGKAAA